MMNLLMKSIGGIKVWILISILAGALALMSFAYLLGVSHEANRNAKDEIKDLQAAIQTVTEFHNSQVELSEERDRFSLSLVRELEGNQQQIRDNTDYLRGQLNALDRLYDDIQLSSGDLRLLNDAISGSGLLTGTSSETSAESPYSDPTATTFTVYDLKERLLADTERYNAAREQCNALIAWIDETLLTENNEQ